MDNAELMRLIAGLENDAAAVGARAVGLDDEIHVELLLVLYRELWR